MSLLAALLLAQAAAPEPEPYRALGAVPLWEASIGGGFMSFATPGRERITIETPPREETELGFAHSSGALSISVEHGRCTDRLTGRSFTDSVRVRVGETHYEGCGGRSPGASALPAYMAAGGEPFWSLEIADGRLSFGVNDETVIVPAPRPRMTRDGSIRIYEGEGISVRLRRRACELEDERVYADEVTVRAGHWTVRGCGGRVIREAPG